MAEMSGHRPFDLTHAMLAMSRFNATSWLQDINIPAVIVVTLQDATLDPDLQRATAARLPQGQTIEIDAPHEAALVTAEIFVPALLEACRQARKTGVYS